MFRKILLLVMACFGVGGGYYIVNAEPSFHKDKDRASAKALLEVARAGLELAEKSPDLRDDYIWSKRVLNAELNLCGNADERIAARERHLKLTMRLEEVAKNAVQKGVISRHESLEAEYHRCEAQVQLDAERDAKAATRK